MKIRILSKQYTNDLTDHGTMLQTCAILIPLSIKFGSMQLIDVTEVYDVLNDTRPLEADLEDEINDLDEDYKDRRRGCFLF